MRIYGKFFGAVLGWMLLRHPIGALIGGLLGHALDAGWLSGSRSAPPPDALQDPYRVLGLSAEASDADVERAYRKMISDYHPDKVSGAAEEIRSLAETRARAINTAYEAIQKQRRAQR